MSAAGKVGLQDVRRGRRRAGREGGPLGAGQGLGARPGRRAASLQPGGSRRDLADGLAWAVASGIAVGVAKLVVTKGLASGWARATGHLPPGVEEVGN